MNLIQRLVFSLMIFSLFTGRAKATPEQEFWTWFTKNNGVLFNFEKNQEQTFDRLAAEMKRINSSLTFEFGPITDGKREFVISADGIKTAFPAVEQLYATAPKLDQWIWIKFRPRRLPMDIEYDGVNVKAADVFCTVEPDGDKAGLTLYIRGYQPEQKKTYAGIVFLMLDQALGEYDVETKVGCIQTKDFSEKSELVKKPLKDVAKIFDDFISYQKKNG